MIKTTTGDILKSEAEALVNTVNCEGYMGKGIAYQFKNKYPEMNDSYMKSCKSGRLKPGSLHCYRAPSDGKIIINFPTKDKWREKSKIEYISSGLLQLKNCIIKMELKSVAIPPLGCGNGGLKWPDVKKEIETILEDLPEGVTIYLYEPANIQTNLQVSTAPSPKLSHLILLEIKARLIKKTKLNMQKSGFFFNYYAQEDYFKFNAHKYGPFCYPIDILSKELTEMKNYYNITTDKKLYDYILTILISDKTKKQLETYRSSIVKSTDFINQFNSHDVELLGTIGYIIETEPNITFSGIVDKIHGWSEEKRKKFSEDDILHCLQILIENNIVDNGLYGYALK